MRAPDLLRRNIEALLTARKENQQSLAQWLGHSRAWLNKFLNGHRGLQLKDLDKIADFFGISTYQLFQPGISAMTERRSGRDRRSNVDRRVAHGERAVHALAAHLNAVRGPQERATHGDIPRVPGLSGPAGGESLEAFIERIAPLVSERIAKAPTRRQAGESSGTVTGASGGGGTAGGRVPKGTRKRRTG